MAMCFHLGSDRKNAGAKAVLIFACAFAKHRYLERSDMQPMSGNEPIFIAEAAVAPGGDGPPQEFVVFMVVWGLLGLGSFLFFHFNRSAALKRQIWPVFNVVIGLIFGGFVYFIMGRAQPQVLFLMIPAVILVSFLNIRTTRFCDSCGKTLYRQPIFARRRFCPHCGSELH
jgi:hypothetical protein